MVLGWKNAPTWMKFGCIVVSLAIGIFLSKLIYSYLNWMMALFITTIIFLILHSIDAKEWSFKCPSWRISYHDDLEYIDKKFNKHNWSELKLNRIQSTWFFLLCLMKNDKDSYKVKIGNKIFWVWGQQSKSYTVMYKMRDSRTYNTLPDSIYTHKTVGGRQYRPKNCQTWEMPSISEDRLLRLASLNYKEVRRIEDIFNMLKISDYKFLRKFRCKETIFRTY